MWPFTGKPTGKTVAEQRKDAAGKAARLAARIRELNAKIAVLEKKIPYERNHSSKKRMEIESLKIAEQLKQLEEQHEKLMKV